MVSLFDRVTCIFGEEMRDTRLSYPFFAKKMYSNPRECNTMFPTSAPTRPEPEFCTCYDCNQTVLNQTVAGFT